MKIKLVADFMENNTHSIYLGKFYVTKTQPYFATLSVDPLAWKQVSPDYMVFSEVAREFRVGKMKMWEILCAIPII